MKLLNCTKCDDVLKLVDRKRTCECGACSGFEQDGKLELTGPHRVLAIAWEDYDGILVGEARTFRAIK